MDMKRTLLLLSLALFACTAEKLDGGSTDGTKSAIGADIAGVAAHPRARA